MRKIVLISLLIGVSLVMMATNRAVVIGVSSYPEESGWRDLSSHNDVLRLTASLPEGWIINVLENEDATKTGILNLLADVASITSLGDTVFVHFSGHGQQMLPLAGDTGEVDMLDEALIPYDACSKWSNNYKGQNHIRDNDFSAAVDKIRTKAGANGLVIVSLDACHSDSMNRGQEYSSATVYRGTSDIFGETVTNEDIRKKYNRDTTLIELHDNSNVVYISACQSHSTNSEIVYDGVGYGSLSYAVSEAFTKVGLNNVTEFVDEVVLQMRSIVPYQTPGIRASFRYKSPDVNITDEITSNTDDTDTGSNTLLWISMSTFLIILSVGFVIWQKRKN